MPMEMVAAQTAQSRKLPQTRPSKERQTRVKGATQFLSLDDDVNVLVTISQIDASDQPPPHFYCRPALHAEPGGSKDVSILLARARAQLRDQRVTALPPRAGLKRIRFPTNLVRTFL